MSTLAWQKSSYSSSGGNNECVELAASSDADSVLLREGDDPGTALTAHPARLAALLAAVKADRFGRLG